MKSARLISTCQRLFGSRGVGIGITLLRLSWISHLDMIVSIVCVITVAAISESFLAMFALIGFGAWNHYTGLLEGKKLSSSTSSTDEQHVSSAMIDRVKNLKPGGALRYNLLKHKVEFVVMESSDFDHVIHLAGLKVRSHDE